MISSPNDPTAAGAVYGPDLSWFHPEETPIDLIPFPAASTMGTTGLASPNAAVVRCRFTSSTVVVASSLVSFLLV